MPVRTIDAAIDTGLATLENAEMSSAEAPKSRVSKP
jgi:hypothetical protein